MTQSNTGYAVLLYDALRADPFYRTLEAAYPDPEGANDAMLRYYDLSIAEAARWGRLGEVAEGYGLSIWSVPLTAEQAAKKSAAKAEALRTAMGPECAATFARIEAAMAVYEDALGLHNHWYLSILAVAPDKQGRGLGGALLAPVLTEADALGVASYLTTFTPRNISFYRKMGYDSAGSFPEPLTGSEFHVLVRPPGGT